MSIKVLKIACDCDGVLVEYNAPFHDLLEKSGAILKPMPLEGPEMWEWYRAYGASPEHIHAAHDKATPSWWGSLPRHAQFTRPVREQLDDLCVDHEVTFLTARPSPCRDATAAWLERYLPLSGQPHVLLTPRRKIMALVALEPDVIIEDNALTLINYAVAERDYKLPACLKLLVDRPYNRQWQQPGNGLVVVKSTMEALMKITLPESK